MKDLYIVGDSLGLARPATRKDMAVSYRDTYVARIRDHYDGSGVHVHHNGRRERTVDEVYYLTDEIIWSRPERVIIQVGIVDCAPRVFSRWQRACLARLPKLIRVPILMFVNKYKLLLLSFRPWVVYTSKKAFKKNVDKILLKFQEHNIKVIFCSIAPAGKGMLSRNPRIQSQINKYNAIINEVVKSRGGVIVPLCDVFKDDCEACLLSDGHHFSAHGHHRLADTLINSYIE
ncbi:SGNH/GDSL hydrolase family protein [Verrucomicrobiaceae bacterium N1E253]|uniref:SGNH/GDSL hydrolase family protein n=1 Tax=Oceaniferula marina TaxID=2748318 RepID=A0A851GH34_9BACT|nr:SGNH/GDSL hydrolase family protein [Oceaniferula marina]NWK55161.1 SGNH/GDSL hydrolase family protein [Oceaniferula marina]